VSRTGCVQRDRSIAERIETICCSHILPAKAGFYRKVPQVPPHLAEMALLHCVDPQSNSIVEHARFKKRSRSCHSTAYS
jgi:hypothetical protein